MRLVSFKTGEYNFVGILDPEDRMVRPFADYSDMINLLEETEGSPELLKNLGTLEGLRLDDINLISPVFPRQLFCVASNYCDHVQEGDGRMYNKERNLPHIFMKPSMSTVIGPDESVVISSLSNKVDWECELAVVIGRKASRVKVHSALDYVAGYTICNDISEREFPAPPEREKKPIDAWFDWLNGKWFDTFAPIGPCITLKDEITDPQNLMIWFKLNEELKQDSSTRLMIYTVAELVSHISSVVSLQPGDVISTGTVAGVGHWAGTYLKPGDVMISGIERIGELRNPVIKESE